MKNQLFINGEWLSTTQTLDVYDPATNAVIATTPKATPEHAAAAVDAAAAAFPGWSEMLAPDRARLVSALGDQLLKNKIDLAKLITAECGKPLKEAAAEVAYAASFLHWSAHEATRVYGEIIPPSKENKRILVLKQPVGVCAAITPWNFPSAMIARKLGPALAAGCTMVIKPSELTPLSAFAIAELAQKVGLPNGALNVITGDAEPIAQNWLNNPVVRKISFTGSTRVGCSLMAKAATHLARVSLELGGHAPFIVFEDADLDAAVQGLLAAKFRNAGQTCVAPNRFFVHEKVYAPFLEKVAEAVGALKVGPGNREGVDIGPLINDAAVAKVKTHIEDAKDKGAQVLAGGALVDMGAGFTDRFFAPTVLGNIKDDMLLNEEETFVPSSLFESLAMTLRSLSRPTLPPTALRLTFSPRTPAA